MIRATTGTGAAKRDGDLVWPRVLLITNWAADARYAGAEAVRRLIGGMPIECIRWACLQTACGIERERLPCWRSFPCPDVHWRLRSMMGEYVVSELSADWQARCIVEWAQDFAPEVVWALPERGAIRVAGRVSQELRLPIHATCHDAPETALQICVPRLAAGIYRRTVRAFFEHVVSYDAVTQELVEHIGRRWAPERRLDGVVVPSSVPRAWMRGVRCRLAGTDGVHRIAFCGAMRTDVEQWTAFVARLGGLGLDFEILLLGWEDSVGRADVPPNVVITQLPYSASERSVIDGLVDAGSEAAYLGLWRNPERSLFVSTSLSSKLATYAAAGLPVLYDGPESTPAWRLIDRYRAGVACSTTEDTVALRAVFEDENAHAELSAGAIRLCRTEFDLDRSVERLRERFVAASKEHTKRPGRKDSA